MPALAEMGGDEAWAVLNAVIDGPGNEPETIQAYLCSLAAESMMSFPAPTACRCAQLFGPSPARRARAAILACLKKSDPQYRKLLEGTAAWAIPWWDVQHSAAAIKPAASRLPNRAAAIGFLSHGHVPDDVYEEARQHFADDELVKLTLAIVAINGWNRFGIAFRAIPGQYQPARQHETAMA